MRAPGWGWGLGVLLIGAAALSSAGLTADLPYPRLGIERLHVQLAVKYGSGDLNPHFFIHPPLLSYLLFGLYGMAFVIGRGVGWVHSLAEFERIYFTDPTVFFVIARVFILAVALGGVVCFYLAAKRLFGNPVAWIAALLCAYAPEFVKWSHYALPTILMFGLFMASFYFVAGILRRGRWSDYLAAGVLGGLATAAKYDGALIVFPLVTAHAMAARSAGRPWLDRRLLAALMSMGAGFLCGAPYTVLDAGQFLKDWSLLNQIAVQGQMTAPGWRIDKPGWLYIVWDALPFGWGLPVAMLGLLGIVHALRRRSQPDLVLLSVIAVALAYISRWQVINPRYFIQVFPFMALLGVDWLVGLTSGVRSARARRILVGVGTALLLLVPLKESSAFARQVSGRPLHFEVKQWIEAAIPSGASIVSLTDLPLVPNAVSITRQLRDIEGKGLGRGIRLQRLLRYLEAFPVTYDFTVLPFPSMAEYEPADFNFEQQMRQGVQYVLLSQEIEEYQAEPHTFGVQLDYVGRVEQACRLLREFRRPWLAIEPPMSSADEFVRVYRCQ